MPHHGADGKLDFCVWVNGIQQRCYLKLKILEITCSSKLNVSFGSEAMQNLELLTARCCSGSTLKFIEVKNLSKLKLKEVRLFGSHDNTLKDDLERQLTEWRDNWMSIQGNLLWRWRNWMYAELTMLNVSTVTQASTELFSSFFFIFCTAWSSTVMHPSCQS